jgi:hypothetical protein
MSIHPITESASDATSRTHSQTPQTETNGEAYSQVPQVPSAENRIADSESLYTPSTTSTKASLSSRLASSKLPLISRSRPSSSTSSSTAGSSNSESTLHTRSSRSRGGGDKHGLIGAIFRKSKAEVSKGATKASHDREEMSKPTEAQEHKGVKDPVKTIPGGKAPAVTFGDLAYRYGAPGAPGARRL